MPRILYDPALTIEERRQIAARVHTHQNPVSIDGWRDRRSIAWGWRVGAGGVAVLAWFTLGALWWVGWGAVAAVEGTLLYRARHRVQGPSPERWVVVPTDRGVKPFAPELVHLHAAVERVRVAGATVAPMGERVVAQAEIQGWNGATLLRDAEQLERRLASLQPGTATIEEQNQARAGITSAIVAARWCVRQVEHAERELYHLAGTLVQPDPTGVAAAGCTLDERAHATRVVDQEAIEEVVRAFRARGREH